MEAKIYQLYCDDEKYEIKVSPLKLCFKDQYTSENVGEELFYRNSNYYFSTNRKNLVRAGREFKEKWRIELQDKIRVIEKIKI